MDMVQLYFGIKCFAAVFVLLFPLIGYLFRVLAAKEFSSFFRISTFPIANVNKLHVNETISTKKINIEFIL